MNAWEMVQELVKDAQLLEKIIEREIKLIREARCAEILSEADAKYEKQLREIDARNAKALEELRAEDKAQIERIKSSVDVEKIRADERERCAKELDIRRAGLLALGETRQADETFGCIANIRALK